MRPPVSEARRTIVLGWDEATLQSTVVELATLLRYRWYHTHDSRRSPSGFPDLVLASPQGSLLFVELKREDGRVTEQQFAWLRAVSARADFAGVWRPSDWLDGTVEHTLRRLQ